MEEELAGAMVEFVGLHRADDGQIIRTLCQMRRELGEPGPGLAVLRELVRRGQSPRAVGHKGELLALQDAVGHRLALELRERRFGVEQIDLRRTAEHVQEDDMPCPGCEVRRSRRAVLGREQRLEGDRAKAGGAGPRRNARR